MASSPSAPPSPLRRVAITTVKLAVSGGLLWLLLARVDLARLWAYARHASPAWLAFALLLYLLMVVISVWRWDLLLRPQGVAVPAGRLFNSYLVATFFNNFLPSNIGGDVFRIRDTAGAVGSRTTATTVILADRGIGLLGLFAVAAIGASVVGGAGTGIPFLTPILWGAVVGGTVLAIPLVVSPGWVATLLRPLKRIHQEWVTERIARMTRTLERFGKAPAALGLCFGGAIAVQAVLVAFYAAVAQSMHVGIPFWHLAVLIPVSFIVQMAPVSVNGFGVREAVFTYYFRRLGLPPESALALSFVGAVLIMLFSLSGAAAYLLRGPSAHRWDDTAADLPETAD